MKYGIDTLHVILNEGDRESIEEILYGEPLEVITDSELECPMEEKVARTEFESRAATVRRCEDGMLEFYLPELVQGDEILDEEFLKESGEDLYYLDFETTVESKGFDDESLRLLRKLGFDV